MNKQQNWARQNHSLGHAQKNKQNQRKHVFTCPNDIAICKWWEKVNQMAEDRFVMVGKGRVYRYEFCSTFEASNEYWSIAYDMRDDITELGQLVMYLENKYIGIVSFFFDCVFNQLCIFYVLLDCLITCWKYPK